MATTSYIVLIISLSSVVCLSSSSPAIENQHETAAQLLLLTARLDGLQAKTDQLSIQLEEEKIHRINLQALNEDLISKNQKHENEIHFLMIQTTQQQEEIRLLKNRNVDNIIKPKKSKIIDSSPRAPPSSCRQLSTIGHYLDGIYLVANQETKKIESVHCDFGSSTLSETLFGNVDVRSKSIHFTVQRRTDFTLNNTAITFEIELLNLGGAIDIATGVFTAPFDGIYHFEFSGMKDVDGFIYVYLQLNGVNIATSYATNSIAYLGLNSISASLRLKTGDQIRLFKSDGAILNDDNQYTYFTGWLVEEDIVFG